LAVFKLDGKMPEVKDKLMRFERGTDNSVLTRGRICEGILKGTEDLLWSGE